MSLKAFHGGSIPSDLPLPSAPGAIARSGSERQISGAWGNNSGRSENRSRPGSSDAVRKFDEKGSFFSQPAHIGRNFDEDERKPLDGASGPRRTFSDEGIRLGPPSPQDWKPDPLPTGRVSERQVLHSVLQSPSLAPSSSPVRIGGATSVGINSQISAGDDGQNVTNSQPNAWAVRKEVMGVTEPMPSSKFAKASALEKVASGMWQSKNPIELLPHLLYSKDNDISGGVGLVNERGSYDDAWETHAERSWIAEDGIGSTAKISPSYEGGRPKVDTEEILTEANFGESQIQAAVTTEVSGPPKLKLLPRSKPMETLEKDHKQGYQQPMESGKVVTVNRVHGNTDPPKPGFSGSVDGNRPVERPKLNLMPRSLPLENSEESLERERKTVFGGARPRELVLKERGIDDLATCNVNLRHTPNRVNDSPKFEASWDHSVPAARHSKGTSTHTPERRLGRDLDRKDHWMETAKPDIQRKSWWNENWRNNSREAERQPQQQPQQRDHRSKPETRHNPIQQPNHPEPNGSVTHRGKVSSALELAQAYSRSASTPNTDDQFSSQTALPGRNQVPFSRLTDNSRHHIKINGY